MAVPVVGSSGGAKTADGTPVNQLTLANVTCAGSNRGLLVMVGIDHDLGNTPAVSSVTFNGDALTFLGSTASGSNQRAELWGMANPDAATGSIVVTLAGGASQEFAFGYIALTSVHQTTPFGTVATNAGTSAAPAVDVATPGGSNDLAVGAVSTQTTGPASTGSQTNRFNQAALNSTLAIVATAYGDTLAGAADGTAEFAWTKAGSQVWVTVGVAVKGTSAATPSNVTTPVVSGTASVGQLLTLTDGFDDADWTNEDTLALQWQRADNLAFTTNVTDIPGAVGFRYYTTTAEQGKYVRCRVRAANAFGTTDAFSNVIGAVAAPVGTPTSSFTPTLTALTQMYLQRGGAVRVVSGHGTNHWTGAASIAIQWQRADDAAFTTNVVDIAGATSRIYVFTAADVGKHVRARVRGTNVNGSTDVFSSSRGPVADPAAPANTELPATAGKSTVGSTLEAPRGSWSNSPLTVSWQWQRADSRDGSWTSIAGATGRFYDPGSADVGKFLRSRLTAVNAAGTSEIFTEPVGPVHVGEMGPLPPRFSVETEWTLDPGSTGAGVWKRVTHLVRSFGFRRGRSRSLDRIEAGTLRVRMDNSDRRFEAGFAGSIVNLLKNPSLEVNGDCWLAQGAGTSSNGRVGDFLSSVAGSAIWRAAPSAGTALQADVGARIANDAAGTRIPVSPSTLYTFSMFLVLSRLTSHSTHKAKLRVVEYNASGGIVATTDSAAYEDTVVPGPASASKRMVLPFVTTPTTASVYLYVLTANAWTLADQVLRVDAAQLELGALTDYIDGASDNGRWAGTAHLSESYRGGPYHPNVRPMRRIRILASFGNPVKDGSLETAPFLTAATGSSNTEAASSAIPQAWGAPDAIHPRVSRVTSPAPVHGTYCYKVVPDPNQVASGEMSLFASRFWSSYSYPILVEPGQTIILSAYLRAETLAPLTWSALRITFYPDETLFNGEVQVTPSTVPDRIEPVVGEWQRFALKTIVPPEARYAVVQVNALESPSVGDVVYVDGVQVDFDEIKPFRAEGLGVQTIYRGFIEGFPQESPSHRRGVVDLTAVDGLAVLAANEYAAAPPSEGSAVRVARVLDDAGWPAALRLLDPGTQTLAADTDLKTSHLQHLQDVAEAELGAAFVDGPGNFVLHDRDHRATAARSTTSQATFGDDAAGAELPYLPSILPDQDVQRVVNHITATSGAASPVPQVVSDATSISRYFKRARSYTTLHSTDAAALTFAQLLLARLKEPNLELDRLEIDPSRDPRLWPVLLALEISDRVTVNRRPQGMDLRSFVSFVEALELDVALQGSRVQALARLSLSPV
jgi:hypothetical protein